MLPICPRIARARPNKTFKATTIKKICFEFCFWLELESRNSGLRTVLFLPWCFQFLFTGKLPAQSLVLSCLICSIHHGMSVGEPSTAGFLIELSDSSKIASRSRVPVQVAN